MLEDYKSYLKWIGNLIAAPALLYVIGFVFIQGAFGPLMGKDDFFFNDYLTVTPVSLNLYLFNGIFIAPAILGGLIIAWIILNTRHSNDNLEQIIVYFYRLERWRWLNKNKVDLLAHIILLIVYSLLAYSLIKLLIWITLNFNHLFTNNFYLFYLVVYFILSLIILSYLKFHTILVDVKFTVNPHMNLMFIVLSAFMYVFTIYFHGLHTQSLKIENFINQKGSVELATVIKKDGTSNQYIYMDTSSDYFIGFDVVNQSTELIVKDSIETINIIKQWYAGEKIRYDESNQIDKESMHLYNVIKTYYSILFTKQVDKNVADQYIKLFSESAMASPEVYQKQLINESYRNKKENDFYGVEFSVAEEEGKSVEIKKTIYVREIWRDTHYDLSFTLISKDKGMTWGIENIENTYFSFKKM